MSSASVTHNFVNGTTANADQVDQNFTDLVSFLNSHVAHIGEHVPTILDRVQDNNGSPTWDDTPVVDIITGNAVTLVSGHSYEITVIIPKIGAAAGAPLNIFKIQVGATVYMEWNMEGASTARMGHRQSVFLDCTADIPAGSTTFKVTAFNTSDTAVMSVPSSGTARFQLVVIDWGT